MSYIYSENLRVVHTWLYSISKCTLKANSGKWLMARSNRSWKHTNSIGVYEECMSYSCRQRPSRVGSIILSIISVPSFVARISITRAYTYYTQRQRRTTTTMQAPGKQLPCTALLLHTCITRETNMKLLVEWSPRGLPNVHSYIIHTLKNVTLAQSSCILEKKKISLFVPFGSLYKQYNFSFSVERQRKKVKEKKIKRK